MLMSSSCRPNLVDSDEESFPLFLPGFRESALRASRATVGGAAYGRGRPSDGG